MPEKLVLPPPEAVKVSDDTYRLVQGFVCSFLFIGEERALLVDAAFGGEGSLKELVESLTDKPIQLVLTHSHTDHIGYIAEFGSAYLHEADFQSCIDWVNGADLELHAINDGDVIDIGGRRFTVLHVPGHSPGSLAFLDKENRILVTGDLIAATLPMYLSGDEDEFQAYMNSLERLSGLKSEYDTIYPSHGLFPLPAEYVDKMIAAGKKMKAGELTPQDPPMPVSGKMYMDGDVGFVC